MISASIIRQTDRIALSVYYVFNFILSIVKKGIHPIDINQDECLFDFLNRKTGSFSDGFEGGGG